jgi:phospholipid-translocating ATPase
MNYVGDKLQTAIEIAFSCNLLSTQMEIMILSADSEEGTRAQIEAGLDKISRNDSSGGYAVVINGETLSFALEVPLKALFLDLTTQCETVVCCRVSFFTSFLRFSIHSLIPYSSA